MSAYFLTKVSVVCSYLSQVGVSDLAMCIGGSTAHMVW